MARTMTDIEKELQRFGTDKKPLTTEQIETAEKEVAPKKEVVKKKTTTTKGKAKKEKNDKTKLDTTKLDNEVIKSEEKDNKYYLGDEYKVLTAEERRNNKIEWITFFRRNIHRFINDYLGIRLYPHQMLEFYAMSQSTNYYEICSRNTAKSWKAGVFACAKSILYPNTEFVIVAESKKQAGIIIEKKIMPLYEKYENLNREIEKIVANGNDMIVKFKNGSTIFVVPLRESARGNRATDLLYEERRRLDNAKLQSIIAPLKHPRQCEFLKLPEFSQNQDLVEEPRTIMLSSSGRDTDEWYKDIVNGEKRMLQGKDSFVIFADYILGLRYNMVTPKQIAKERANMDEETFAIEYENALIRENKDSFFAKEVIDSCRVLKNAYYPQLQSRYDSKKNPYAPTNNNGEKNILVIDIALKAGEENDNTIFSIARLIPTKKGYELNYVYQEPMRGKNALIQGLRIKQLWYDFNVSYIVLDANNAGSAVYDILTEKTFDEERGIEYPAMTTMYHKTITRYQDYKERTRSTSAIPIIYPMWATDAINSEMAFLVRENMKTGMLKLLCNPAQGEDYLVEQSKLFNPKTDMSLLPFFMRPYYQASETETEMLSLNATYTGNTVKLSEPRHRRKDRWTTIGYGCWFVKNVLDTTIVKEEKVVDFSEQVVTTTSTNTSNSNNKYFGTNKGFQPKRKLFGR